MRAILTSLVLLLMLSSCAYYSKIEAERHTIGQRYSVVTPIEWSGTTDPRGEKWTVNGPLLDNMSLLAGVKEGDSLITSTDSEVEFPKFRSKMRASQVAELVADTLAKTGSRNIETANLRPSKFGDRKGFRFDFSYTSEDGLIYAGKAIGAVSDGMLDMVIFSAARPHYYPTYQQRVEEIFKSIETAKGA